METKGTTMSKEDALKNLRDPNADHTEARRVLITQHGFSKALCYRIEDEN